MKRLQIFSLFYMPSCLPNLRLMLQLSFVLLPINPHCLIQNDRCHVFIFFSLVVLVNYCQIPLLCVLNSIYHYTVCLFVCLFVFLLVNVPLEDISPSASLWELKCKRSLFRIFKTNWQISTKHDTKQFLILTLRSLLCHYDKHVHITITNL